MRYFWYLLALVCLTSAAQAQVNPAVPYCVNPWDMYVGAPDARPFRPLVTFTRKDRMTPAPAQAAGPLDVDMTVRQGDVRIGEYTVHHTPYTQFTPTHDSAAYLDRHDGATCRLRANDLKAPAFVAAWGYSAGLFALMQDDRLRAEFRSALKYDRPLSDADTALAWRPDRAPFGGAPCQMSNNHTHGLLVLPYENGERLGDNIFPLARPSRARDDGCVANPQKARVHAAHAQVYDDLHYDIRIPSRPDGGDFLKALESGRHPSGLFWFHPHPHGYSAAQLNGGTTGLISIGRLCDYMTDCAPGAVAPPASAVRHMLIKDAQIEPVAGGFDFRGKTEPGLCDPTDEAAGTSFWQNAECTYRGAAADMPPTGTKWVFTINGVQKPRIAFDSASADGEIWRLANTSPTLSYHLSIIPLEQAQKLQGRDPANVCRKFFRILAKDGAGVPDATDAGRQTLSEEKEILLMPGARIEIRVSDLGAREWAIVQEGLETGGDTWPRTIMATLHPAGGATNDAYNDCSEIVMITGQPPETTKPQTRGPTARASVASLRATSVPTSHAPRPIEKIGACDTLAGRQRLIQFVKNNKYGGANDGWQQKDLFGLLAGVREAPAKWSGAELDRDARRASTPDARYFRRDNPHVGPSAMVNAAYADFATLLAKPYNPGDKDNFVPSFNNFPEFNNICVTQDPSSEFKEIWILENWTNEIHNFHIHQSRFFVASGPSEGSAAWLGDPLYFDFPCDSPAYLDSDADAAACNKPTAAGQATRSGYGDELIAMFFRGRSTTGAEDSSAALASSAHDSVPVPRGACVPAAGAAPDYCAGDGAGCDGTVGNPNCRPGRITLRMPFNRAEQVGKFVFHCHILEHEDRGMMGTIVVRPAPVRASEFSIPGALTAWRAKSADPLADPPICYARPAH